VRTQGDIFFPIPIPLQPAILTTLPLNLETAIERDQAVQTIDPKNGSCSGETLPMLRQAQHERFFEVLTQMVKSPFALSSLRSERVEGFRTWHLPFLG